MCQGIDAWLPVPGTPLCTAACRCYRYRAIPGWNEVWCVAVQVGLLSAQPTHSVPARSLTRQLALALVCRMIGWRLLPDII